jgi:AcrR family transcriptional regulator
MTEEVRRQRGRPRRDEPAAEADDVLSAALHAFAVRGYDGVSVRELNKELGVSHNALHQRFGSKEAVWYAAVDWGFGGLVSALLSGDDAAADGVERLRTFVRTFVAYSARHPELQRVISAEAGEGSARLTYVLSRYVVPVVRWFEPLYDELVAAGRIRAVPKALFYTMVTAGGGTLFSNAAASRYLFGDEVLGEDAVEAYAAEAADFVVGGLVNR